MSQWAGPDDEHVPRARPTIVLVVPEALADDHLPVPLFTDDHGTAARLLVCLSAPLRPALLLALHNIDLPTQFLIGPDVEAPAMNAALVARMPPGSTPGELEEFALTLADALLASPGTAISDLIKLAKKLDKPIIEPGGAVNIARSWQSMMRRLDPMRRGWRSLGKGLSGRFEQLLLELLAFNWAGKDAAGTKKSRTKVRKALGWKWHPAPYFLEDADLQECNIDEAALVPDAPIVGAFEALDRTALHGSYIHRDLIWAMHIGAALAVLAAVAGSLVEDPLAWGLVELITLALIGFLVMAARRALLQDRWTACRLGAEQLRIARMCLPLFVTPAALSSVDSRDSVPSGARRIDFAFLALAEAKRAVREQGLPRLVPGCTAVDAARWVHRIVAGQTAYHNSNHRKLEQAENRLTGFSNGLFFIAVGAVILHLLTECRWLLLVTAAGPAFAAAAHGTAARLGLVHRIALSHEVEHKLRPIEHELKALIDTPQPTEEAWRKVRHLAARAADAMGDENSSWHSLVRRYGDSMP